MNRTNAGWVNAQNICRIVLRCKTNNNLQVIKRNRTDIPGGGEREKKHYIWEIEKKTAGRRILEAEQRRQKKRQREKRRAFHGCPRELLSGSSTTSLPTAFRSCTEISCQEVCVCVCVCVCACCREKWSLGNNLSLQWSLSTHCVCACVCLCASVPCKVCVWLKVKQLERDHPSPEHRQCLFLSLSLSLSLTHTHTHTVVMSWQWKMWHFLLFCMNSLPTVTYNNSM